MQGAARLLQLRPRITDPKIHLPFGGPAVIKAGHEQKRARVGVGRGGH